MNKPTLMNQNWNLPAFGSEIFGRGLWDADLSKYFSDLPSPLSSYRPALMNPKCEINEAPDAYHIKVEVPGMSKEQIKVDLNDNMLTIAGERKEEKKEDSKKRQYSEINYGSFSRTFSLPNRVDPEKIAAKYENGILNVDVQKITPTTTRQINVK